MTEPEQEAEALVPIDNASGEDEDDVVGRLGAQRANISATDWTVETLFNQMVKGRLDLEPAFQRRAAWTPALKSKFIESSILNYPIPQIVLAEKADRPGHFFVIDGKQRLLALRQFYAGSEGASESDGFRSFRLSTVTVISDIKNFTLERLQKERPELYDSFETHTIRTVVVRNWGSEDFLYALFLRLNTGSVPLSPQELRQALAPGPFVSFVDQSSGDSRGLRKLLGNKGPDRRMVDAEILVRLYGMHSPGVKYTGNLKDFLDKTCQYYNKTWAEHELQLTAELESMEESIDALYQVFNGQPCRKWSSTRYERSFNRALFDVQVGALLPGVEYREAALSKSDALAGEFKRLCDEDAEFSRAVSTTTKTRDAVRIRFERWFEVFASVTGLRPPWPAGLADLTEG